jgi:hypothetical protein
MAPSFAKNLHEQIGTAIDYLWVFGEICGSIHHAKDVQHSLDPVQGSEKAARRRKQDKTRAPGMAIGLPMQSHG